MKRIRRIFWYHKKAVISITTIMILISIAVAIIFTSKEKGITGNELLVKQTSQLNTMKSFLYSCDDIYTLYIIGGISEETFKQEVEVLQGQYLVLNQSYKNFLSENKVLPDSHSYISRRGCDGVDSAWKHINEFLSATIVNGKALDKTDTLYLYLNYNNVIQEDIAEYIVAYRWLCEQENLVTDFKETVTLYDNEINERLKGVE